VGLWGLQWNRPCTGRVGRGNAGVLTDDDHQGSKRADEGVCEESESVCVMIFRPPATYTVPKSQDSTSCSYFPIPIGFKPIIIAQRIFAFSNTHRLHHVNNESKRHIKRSFKGSSHGGARAVPHVQHSHNDTRVVREIVSRTSKQRQGRLAQDIRKPDSTWPRWFLGRLDTTRGLFDGMERVRWVGGCKHVSEHWTLATVDQYSTE
jgi:hypothetical protein